MKNFTRGLKAGIPIGLGYLSVSFTFGIIAHTMGYKWWQAVFISALTLTSAGQFAGIETMLLPGRYIEMLISQLTINVRYSFMGISLAQKTNSKFRGIYRWLLGFFITDEIFSVAVTEKSISRSFFLGLSTIPWFGWTIGTTCGVLLGNVLPASVLSALGLAIYGMFIAIVVPEMKKFHPVICVVFIAIALSIVFKYVPVINKIPSGFVITICAITAALIGAVFFPVDREEEPEDE